MRACDKGDNEEEDVLRYLQAGWYRVNLTLTSLHAIKLACRDFFMSLHVSVANNKHFEEEER